MNFKFSIFIWLILFLLTGCCVIYFAMHQHFQYVFFAAAICVLVLFKIFSLVNRLFSEIHDFTEAVQYGDFTRRWYDDRNPLSDFHRCFNVINQKFTDINQTKEAQQQYLVRILELVDTGIWAYDINTNETMCLNEAMTNILHIPNIKNISWLEKHNKALYDELTTLPVGNARMLSLNTGGQAVKTLVNTSLFTASDRTCRLIAVHNISATFEEIEAGAWKGLLRVMTHEIMNSIALVSSLADTLEKQISQRDTTQPMPSEDLQDIQLGMETIKRRSDGLLRFADTYKTLSKTMVPELSKTNVPDMLDNIYQLMHPSLINKGIKLETFYSDIPDLLVDQKLIEQVIINFITNACEAVSGKTNPHIVLTAGFKDDEVSITVADNGKGIPTDLLEKIFIPFFSTRKNGNGIGLSLCRQIVKAHNAQLKIQSKEGEGSAFTVVFKFTPA